jgi:WD40 repeat protein
MYSVSLDGSCIAWHCSVFAQKENPVKITSYKKEMKLHDRGVSSLCYYPRSNLLLSGGEDKKLVIYDTEQKEIRRTYRAMHKGAISSISISGEEVNLDDFVFTSSLDNKVRIINLT